MTLIWSTNGNPAGSTSRPPEFFNLFRHLVVAHMHDRVEWSEYDTTAMDTIDRGVVRHIRVLWVWCRMLIVIKVDTASMGLRLGEWDSIMWIELLAIILASAAWGPAWQGQRIIMHCDNTGAVTVANSRVT